MEDVNPSLVWTAFCHRASARGQAQTFTISAPRGQSPVDILWLKLSPRIFPRLPWVALIDIRVIETDGTQIQGIDIPTPRSVYAVLDTFTAQRNAAAAAQEYCLLLLTLGTNHE
jgi:hypothetical protein